MTVYFYCTLCIGQNTDKFLNIIWYESTHYSFSALKFVLFSYWLKCFKVAASHQRLSRLRGTTCHMWYMNECDYIYSIGILTVDSGKLKCLEKMYSSTTLPFWSPIRIVGICLKILGYEYMNVFEMKTGSNSRIL